MSYNARLKTCSEHWLNVVSYPRSDKVYLLLAHGRWFSTASSTTKTGRHDRAEIFLKVVLNTINQIKSNSMLEYRLSYVIDDIEEPLTPREHLKSPPVFLIF